MATEAQRRQREAALAKANRHRFERAQLKRDLKAGRVFFLTLLERPPECILSATIGEILVHVRGIGRTKVRWALRRARIHQSATFGGLNRDGRWALERYLELTHPRTWHRDPEQAKELLEDHYRPSRRGAARV